MTVLRPYFNHIYTKNLLKSIDYRGSTLQQLNNFFFYLKYSPTLRGIRHHHAPYYNSHISSISTNSAVISSADPGA
jgi:hypothetical protein